MKIKSLLVLCFSSLLLFSCVSTKKFKAAQAKYDELNQQYVKLQGDLKNCNDQTADLNGKNRDLTNQVDALNKQVAFLKENNNIALKQMQDLSVITGSQAESIKKSLENIGAKDAYIQTLQQAMAHKDSLNMALVMNLKGAIGNLEDQDINIKVDKGCLLYTSPSPRD